MARLSIARAGVLETEKAELRKAKNLKQRACPMNHSTEERVMLRGGLSSSEDAKLGLPVEGRQLEGT